MLQAAVQGANIACKYALMALVFLLLAAVHLARSPVHCLRLDCLQSALRPRGEHLLFYQMLAIK